MGDVQSLSGYRTVPLTPTLTDELTSKAYVDARTPQVQVGVLTADKVMTSNTTLSNATGLAFTVVANGFYGVEMFFRHNAATTTPDFKLFWLAPVGVSGWWSPLGILPAGTGPTSGIPTSNLWSDTVAQGSALSAMIQQPVGGLIVGATGGTVQLQVAQNTSSADAMTLYAGTWIRATKLN